MIALGLTQPPRRHEVRESGYTAQVISRLMAGASGASDGAALGVIETASRLWAAGLATASVKPASLALSAVTSAVLADIGRGLCRHGESVHLIDVSGGQVRLIPCASWTISGGPDPASWRYRVTSNGPSSTRTMAVEAGGVLHVRYAPSAAAPWRGRSPLMLAADTARAASRLEAATSEELSFTQSQMLSPRRSASDYGSTEALSPEAVQQLVDSFAQHTDARAFIVPSDMQASRLGPEPPTSFPLIRDRLENSLLALHGIPPALIAVRGTGTALRESLRQLGATLLRPLGELVTLELREKLDPNAALDFSALRSADVQGAARALKALTDAGMDIADAREATGL